MPACFPRRNEAIVLGWWVGRSVGDALPVGECGCSCEMQLGEFTTSDQKMGSLDDGLDCGLPSCVLVGKVGSGSTHTAEGFSWSSAPAPDHRYVSPVRWSYAGAGVPRLPAIVSPPHFASASLHLPECFILYVLYNMSNSLMVCFLHTFEENHPRSLECLYSIDMRRAHK